MRRLAASAAACLVVVPAASMAMPSPAAARVPLKSIWGPTRMPNGSNAFRVYRRLGVDVFQAQLVWSQIAPTRPTHPTNPNDPAYQWPQLVDQAVRYGRRRGIAVALMVRASPPWANGGHTPEWTPNTRDYARFLTAASRRYRRVRRWMIWGEPNRAAAFQPGGSSGPRAYARLLDRAYGALKRRSRRNIVVGGMTFTYGEIPPRNWLRAMRLPNGRPPRLDEFGHNPFSGRPPLLRLRPDPTSPGARDIADLDTYTRQIRRTYRRIGRKPRIWISEYTVASDRPNRAINFAVRRHVQARWLTLAFGIARRVGAAGFGWFNLHDEPVSMPNGLTMGLMTYEGQRKPAFRAYARLP